MAPRRFENVIKFLKVNHLKIFQLLNNDFRNLSDFRCKFSEDLPQPLDK